MCAASLASTGMKDVLKFARNFSQHKFKNPHCISNQIQNVSIPHCSCIIIQKCLYTSKAKKARDLLTLKKKDEQKKKAKKMIPFLEVKSSITVKELASLAGRSPDQVSYALRLVQTNQAIKDHTDWNEPMNKSLIPKVVKKLGYRPLIIADKVGKKVAVDEDIYIGTPSKGASRPRPPVVTVMGHVDHGKTTLLDALRKTSIAMSEAGGITQSIGAFSVSLTSDQKVTFIDTPGHAIFTTLRERGAKVTDLVVLVVAADDGVMDQTVESINLAKMAEAAIIVAINKCDKAKTNPKKVIAELEDYGLRCEEIGGNIQAVCISALKNKGLDELVRCILTEADLLELRADPKMPVQAVIIESKTETGRGPVASLIVQQGTLKRGKFLVAGTSIAKVRSMWDSNRNQMDSAGPGTPVEVIGWKSLPSAGYLALEVKSESRAKKVVKQRERDDKKLKADEILPDVEEKRRMEREEYENIRKADDRSKKRVQMSHILLREKSRQVDTTPELRIIVKADVDGSMDALIKILNSYDCNEDCKLKLVHQSIGDLMLSEVELAIEFEAPVFLFNTDVSPDAKATLNSDVDIRKHTVIYKLVNDLKDQISKRMLPVEVTNIKGGATVIQMFKRKNDKNETVMVAGCTVGQGMLSFRLPHRINRNGQIIHTGNLESLRHFGKSISTAKQGSDCGVLFETGNEEIDIQVGDTIECFSIEHEPAKVTWNPPGF